MAFADYTSHGAVAVITLNHPPVNALGLNVRKDYRRRVGTRRQYRIDRRRGHHGRRSDVLRRSGRERVRLAGNASPPLNLTDLCALVEGFPKPVIAALNGLALGGGLGTRHGLPLSVGVGRGAAGLTRSEARALAGRGRHATIAAPRGRRARIEHDRRRQSGRGPRVGFHEPIGLGGRRRCAVGGDRLFPAQRRGEIAPEESARLDDPIP